MFIWKTCDDDTILYEMAVMNSNPEFVKLSEDKSFLTKEDILAEHEEEIEKERYLILENKNPAAIADFTMCNPRDKNPWLGLFILHKNYQNQGYAVQIYHHYEDMMKQRDVAEIHLGCFAANADGLDFWGKLGFVVYEERDYAGKLLMVMKKKL
ncbi:GNAT family N-acetyltransferase [Peribacillus sp. B-H-3]|jgi:GNAT superfamily N-acetyltransferase|uniref:GNAT family N-acetyltransferase n=1 Tax=Peribacillus sp. B-H-3 TaxID=3400420 RepID=UPI003B02C60F